MRRSWAVFTLFLFMILVPRVSLAQEVRVVYLVDTVHEGQYTAHVMLTNMTSVPLSNWTMTFRIDQHITNIEHVNWSEFQDVFTVSGQGWTHRIEPGELAWFTITGIAYDGIPEPPRNCFFNGTACTVEPHPNQVPLVAQSSEMIVSAWIEEYDFTTYRGFFVVQNPTDRVFSAPWGLQFSTPSRIVDIENVVWNRSGTDYQLYGNAHTDIVRPHDFVLIPFSGVHTGIPSLPTNCKLNGSVCSFQPPDRLVETPRLTVYLKMGEVTGTTWEGYIRIENSTVNELSSWTLRFNMANTITESEGVIVDRSSGLYTIRPAFGRGRIMPQSEYTFVIKGTWGGKIEPPEGCTINSIPCLLKFEIQQDVQDSGDGGTGTPVDPPDTGGTGGDPTVSCDNPVPGAAQVPEIDFRFISVQPSTYVGFIDITNTGVSIIRGWALEFKLVNGMTVNNIWPSNWVLVGGNYRVTPVADNDCIKPGETIRINIQGNHDGNFGEPIGCNFAGDICIFQKTASVAVEDELDYLPVETATLHPAYPNPFNPQSRIHFDVTRAQSVRVELWDSLGRLRQTLFDGYATTSTANSLQIDGSNLPSGMYFVRLVPTSGRIQTQAIILQK